MEVDFEIPGMGRLLFDAVLSSDIPLGRDTLSRLPDGGRFSLVAVLGPGHLSLLLHRDRRLSQVMISHDPSVIRCMSHRVAVFFQGRLVEVAATPELFTRPRHEHSRQPVAAALPRVCAILESHRLPQGHLDALR